MSESSEVKKVLKATHFGALKIGEKELNCAVLEDGTRVLSNTAIFKAFDRPRKGKGKEIYRTEMPSFIDANNLKPFINEVFGDGTGFSIEYINNGRILSGYKAEMLPLICEVYLKARDMGVLTTNQEPLAVAAEVLVRGLSKVGIIALIDEATGYQYDRQKDELQKILKAYIAPELLPWTKRFPDEFYENLFRLHGWQYNPLSVKKPSYVGKLTMDLVYNQLPPGVADELKNKTPKSKAGHYTKRFHQSLTSDIGEPHLEKQVAIVTTLMKISPNWRTFKSHFSRAFGGQLSIDEINTDEESN